MGVVQGKPLEGEGSLLPWRRTIGECLLWPARREPYGSGGPKGPCSGGCTLPTLR